MYTHAQHTQCIHAHTCTHTHTMHTCTHMHPHTHNAYMHTQGGASINRTARLFGKGEGGPHIWPKTKAGGGGGGGEGGGPSQSGIKQGGLTNPPGYRPAYTHTWHTCIFTHTHAFTHTMHTLTHMHVYMCIASCAYTNTHTQKYCWTANTL